MSDTVSPAAENQTASRKAKVQSPANVELRQRTALAIFMDRMRRMPKGVDAKVVAAQAFRESRAFCEMAEAFSAFGEDAIESVLPPEPFVTYQNKKYVLDDASAPHLDARHPFNQRSKRFGSLETLEKMVRLEHENPDEYRKLCNAVGSIAN